MAGFGFGFGFGLGFGLVVGALDDSVDESADDDVDESPGSPDVGVPARGPAGGSTTVIEESVPEAPEPVVSDPAMVVTEESDAAESDAEESDATEEPVVGAAADGEPPDPASVSPLHPVRANAAMASPITACLMRLRCLVLSIYPRVLSRRGSRW